MLLLLSIPLLLGFALLILGIRGRQVSTHAHCRACKFDLHGLPSPTTCPECGGNLAIHGAIRQGLRQASRFKIAFGAALIAFTITSGAVFSGVFGAGRMSLMPTWALIAEAKAGTPTADRALDELHTRLLAQKLTLTDVGPIVSHTLALQADTTKPWRFGWGDFLEAARSAGMVSDADWALYARHSVVIPADPRRTIRVGDPFTVQLIPTFRCADPSILELRPSWYVYWNSTEQIPIAVEWQGFNFLTSGMGPTPMQTRLASFVGVQDIPGISRPTAVGATTLEFAIAVTVVDPSLRSFDASLFPAADSSLLAAEKRIAPRDLAMLPPPNAVASWKQLVSESISVVSVDSEVIELIRDPSVAPSMRDAAQTLRLRKNTQYDSCSSVPQQPMHHIQAVMGQVPLPAVFKIIIEDAEFGPLELTTIRCLPFGDTSVCLLGPYPPQLSRERVTVRLVPDITTAMEVHAIKHLWGDEIVLDDVPVYDVAKQFGNLNTFPATAKSR